MKIARIALAVAALSLGGCAATVNKSYAPGQQAVSVPAESRSNVVLNVSGDPQCLSSADWDGFHGLWIGALKTEASARAVHFSTQDGPPVPSGEHGTLVQVQVHDYRWLTAGARFGFGIMTGNAYIDATVSFVDLDTGKPFGQQQVNTSSTAWQGAFSAMTDKQLAAVAQETMKDIQGQ